jgi:hypothetical protein
MPKGGKGNESLLTPQKWAGKGNESPQNETKFFFFLLFISISNMYYRLRQKNNILLNLILYYKRLRLA